MTQKTNWLYRQSAVIPYVKRKGHFEIVLVTSSSARHWIFPKGIIEPDMSPQDSAAKEALEEAGISGKVASEMIAEYEYEKWGGICSVQVYPMKVAEILDEWDEKHFRRREIVSVSKAINRIRDEQRPSLEHFQRLFC